MPQFACRLCGVPYEAPEEVLGSQLPCPSCGREITAGESVTGFRGGDAASMSDTSVFVASRSGPQKRAPGYASPMAWVALVVGTAIVALALFGLLAMLSLKFKPLIPIVVYWVPALLGVLCGATAFINQANRNTASTPTWIIACAVALAIPMALGPIWIFKSKHARSARVQLVQQVNQALQPPYLPDESPDCISVGIGEAIEFPRHEIQIFLEGDRSYKGTADVNLSQATLHEGMPAIQIELAGEAGEPVVRKLLKTYPLFEAQPAPDFRITAIPKTGRYAALLTPANKIAFSVALLVSKSSFVARLERASHIRASSIPQATTLAKRLLGTQTQACEDIHIGKPLDDTHLQATALLEGQKEIPVLLEITRDDKDTPEIRVLLAFGESAIVQINEELSSMDSYDGVRCINVDKKRKLRNNEYALRALFASTEPRDVLIRQSGYDLAVTPEPYRVLTQAGTRSASSGWSLLAPARYERGKAEEFSLVYASAEPAVRITIEHKVISEYAGFDLRSEALRDRETWSKSRTDVQVSDLESWSAPSGLKGHYYAARKGKIMRSRYYVMHEQHLAMITCETGAADRVKAADFEAILSTLRFDDEVQIASP